MSHNRDEDINKGNGINHVYREQTERKIWVKESSDFNYYGRYHWGFCQVHSGFLIRLSYPQGWISAASFLPCKPTLLVEVDQSRINYPRLTGQDKNVELLGSLYSLWFSLRNRESWSGWEKRMKGTGREKQQWKMERNSIELLIYMAQLHSCPWILWESLYLCNKFLLFPQLG